ncbi:hypothetical protein LP420_20905 [Massilia sp. B-10]|nr:hypothetical protein LP420_20905 [Massilia sp. B-10]
MNNRADATVELRLAGHAYPYFAEVRQVDRIAALHQVKQQFADVNGAFLLVAPRISSELAERCREIGVQFIDADGNAYLQAPGLFVFIKGQRHANGHALSDVLPGPGGSVSASRLTFALLCAPELLSAPYRFLSQIAGVSLGAIGPVFNDLAKRGYITKAKKDRRFLEKAKLMDEWVTIYASKLRPKLAPRRFSASDRDWWKKIDIEHFDAAWGGEVAADKMTNYLKPEKITIYMNAATMRHKLGKLVIQNKLRADPHGEIEILEKFWDLSLDHEHQACVPPLLVYADLMASMEPRNLDTAAKIYRQLIHAN